MDILILVIHKQFSGYCLRIGINLKQWIIVPRTYKMTSSFLWLHWERARSKWSWEELIHGHMPLVSSGVNGVNGELCPKFNQHLSTASAWSCWFITVGDDNYFLNLEVFTAFVSNSLHDGASLCTDTWGKSCVLHIASSVKLASLLGLEASSNIEARVGTVGVSISSPSFGRHVFEGASFLEQSTLAVRVAVCLSAWSVWSFFAFEGLSLSELLLVSLVCKIQVSNGVSFLHI